MACRRSLALFVFFLNCSLSFCQRYLYFFDGSFRTFFGFGLFGQKLTLFFSVSRFFKILFKDVIIGS